MKTTYLDQDNRREPRTNRFCVACHKDLKPGQPHRMVHLVNGGPFVLHPSEEAAYVSDAGDLAFFPIGSDCARRLGVEWTHPAG